MTLKDCILNINQHVERIERGHESQVIMHMQFEKTF